MMTDTPPQEERGLVPAGPTDINTTEAWTPPGGAGGILYSSLPLTLERKDRIAIYNAVSGDAEGVKSLVNTEIEIEHVVVHNVELTDPQSGEISEHRRLVMLGPVDSKSGERRKVAAISNGTEQSLRKLVAIMGNPPWTPPIKARVRQVKTRRGFDAITLELLP